MNFVFAKVNVSLGYFCAVNHVLLPARINYYTEVARLLGDTE